MTKKDKQVAEFQSLYANASVEDKARMMTILQAMRSGRITTDQVKAAAHSGNPRALADSLALSLASEERA